MDLAVAAHAAPTAYAGREHVLRTDAEEEHMPVPQPSETTRWRCAQCGNLTRFDVVRSSRVREFVHVDLAGVAKVEETDVLADSVERVVCRWCGGEGTVELVARPDSA